MSHWSESIERQIIMALAQRNVEAGHFDPHAGEQLWSWQGKRRIAIKDVLALDLPAIYVPPKADLIEGEGNKPENGQIWHIQTQHDNKSEVFLQSAEPADSVSGYVIRLFDQSDAECQKSFCQEVSKLGPTAVATSLRGSKSTQTICELAEVYLGLGRCFGEAVTRDLMRITDHLEDQFDAQNEPIILIASGYAIPMALAYAAIDQRVSGLILDYTNSPKLINQPTGLAPFFLGQYSLLGPNPALVMMQCCAPKPMIIVNHESTGQKSWLEDTHAGVLSFADQLGELAVAYESSDALDRLTIIEPGQTPPMLTEMITTVLQKI